MSLPLTPTAQVPDNVSCVVVVVSWRLRTSLYSFESIFDLEDVSIRTRVTLDIG